MQLSLRNLCITPGLAHNSGILFVWSWKWKSKYQHRDAIIIVTIQSKTKTCIEASFLLRLQFQWRKMALSSKGGDFSVISIYLFVPLKLPCSGCLGSPPPHTHTKNCLIGHWGGGALRFFLVVIYLRKGVLQIVMKVVQVQKKIPEKWKILLNRGRISPDWEIMDTSAGKIKWKV